MYTHILIPTDGSELAGKAVQHGVALAKRIGAKVTMLTVLPRDMSTTDSEMIEIRKERMQKQLDARNANGRRRMRDDPGRARGSLPGDYRYR